MKKRVITGAVYVVVLIGLLVMKWLVPDGYGSVGFDALFCAVSIIGCLEFLKAVKVVSFPQRAATVAFCAAAVPLFTAVQMIMQLGLIAVAVLEVIFIIINLIFYACHADGSNGKSTLLSLAAMVYCGDLCVVLSAVNHMSENSMAAILLLFLAVMLTDCFAFIVGIAFKKWLPYKLAPKISPNKTIIGGAGGLIGGMLGGVIAYYLDMGLGVVAGSSFSYGANFPACVAFLLIGLIVSVAAQLGDLTESAIKRKCEIKDTGKLLPGHGGVLDRFDSMLFAGVIVFISFIILGL